MLEIIRKEGCTIPAVMLTMSDSEVDLGKAVLAGAVGPPAQGYGAGRSCGCHSPAWRQVSCSLRPDYDSEDDLEAAAADEPGHN